MSKKNRLKAIQSVSQWLPQTATWLYTQVRYLPKGIESHVVCEATTHLDQFPHDHIHSLADLPRWKHVWDKSMRKLGLRRHLHFLVETARRHDARLLHSHFGYYAWRNIGAARKANLKHIVTFYGVDVVYYPTADPSWNERYRELFNHVDRVLCEGEHMAACIVALGCPKEKVRVHHLGINLDQIPYRPRTWQPGEPLRVFLAGTFREKKGFPDALEALGRLGKDVQLEITIVGDDHSKVGVTDFGTAAEKARILETIAAYQLGERTRLLGFQPYSVVLEEASRHHVFLSPSVTSRTGDTEGGAPVSIIEMSGSGMMVVSTKHCDIPGVVIDGVTGLLAEEHDIDGLVGHLRWLIEHPDRWRAMQDAGRRHIEAEFDSKRQGERLGAIYREVVGKNNGP